MSSKILIGFLLVIVVVNADWFQRRSNSRRSNFSNTTSENQQWTNLQDRIFAVNELVIEGDLLIASTTGWGFCYAPTYFFFDRNTGTVNQELKFSCGVDNANVVAAGESVYSVVNEPYPRHSFLIDQQGYVHGFNQTGYVTEILMTEENRVLFNIVPNRFGPNVEGTLSLYDLSAKQEIWSLINRTTGSVAIGIDQHIYALSVDRSQILIISTTTGFINRKIDLYSAIDSALFLLPEEGDNIYAIERSDRATFIRAYNPKKKDTGYTWTSKPFGGLDPYGGVLPVSLDNTGKFIITVDAMYKELSILSSADGDTVKVLSHVDYIDIAGITQNNDIVAVAPKRVDILSVEGNVVKSVNIPYGEKCVIDRNAVYCCTASNNGEFEKLRCEKTIL